MTVSESTKQAEGLVSFFKFLGRISAKAVKKLATNVLKIQGELESFGNYFKPQLQLKVLKQLYQVYLKL